MIYMNHRERILKAINLQQPDMVPIDLGGARDSSIVVEGYEKLKKHFNVSTESVYSDRMMRVVRVDEKILDALDIDVRGIFPGSPKKNKVENYCPSKYTDMWGIERIHPENSFYYDQTNFPLSGNISKTDILNYKWPDPRAPELFEEIKERLQWIRANTDCAAVLSVPAPFVHTSQYLRGFEDWYCDFITSPDLLETLFDAVLEVNLEMAKTMLNIAGKDVDIVICGDDLGAQLALQIPPETFRKYIKPRLKKYFQQIHSLSPAKFMFHCCGAIFGILDDLIEIGVDILNPIQTSAAGMDPVALKKKFGKKLTFWGAMDTQKVLPEGSIADVKKMVEERIEQLGEGGGFVLTSCHNIQPDVPVENILAMFDHARQYVPSYMK